MSFPLWKKTSGQRWLTHGPVREKEQRRVAGQRRRFRTGVLFKLRRHRFWTIRLARTEKDEPAPLGSGEAGGQRVGGRGQPREAG